VEEREKSLTWKSDKVEVDAQDWGEISRGYVRYLDPVLGGAADKSRRKAEGGG
jgi:hypothetical protein